MPQIDLNADLGEGVTDDEGLLGVVTSANLACGFHAGDEATMRAVCAARPRRGAWWSGPRCPTATGRTSAAGRWTRSPSVLTGWVREQVELLTAIAAECGTEVAYLKPHGALYNRVVDDEEQAAAVLAGQRVAAGARAARAPRSCAWRRPRGGPACTRGSRTGATPTRAGWCPATSPARWSRGPRRSPPTPWRWRGRERCARCASTVTPRGRRGRRGRCARRSRGGVRRPALGDLRPSWLVHRAAVVHRNLWTACGQPAPRCGGSAAICGRGGREPKMVGTSSEFLLCPGLRVA